MIMGLGVSRNWRPQDLIHCLQDHGFRPAVFDLPDSGKSTHMTLAASTGPYRAMFRGKQAAYSAEDLTDDGRGAFSMRSTGPLHTSSERRSAESSRSAWP
jgi:hypothetical protein